MRDEVKTRAYSSARRRQEAERRRRAVLTSAHELFSTRGYGGTSMTAVARAAGVAVDTIYATVGRKPQLLLAVHDLILGDMAVGEGGEPVPALQRAYVLEVRAADTAVEKIRLYTTAMARLLPRTAPLLEALREAGGTEPECRAAWEGLEERRAANMRLFAADLRSTGDLRDDLDDEEVADIIWSMGPAYFSALAQRGWTPERYAALVADAWTRLLLA